MSVQSAVVTAAAGRGRVERDSVDIRCELGTINLQALTRMGYQHLRQRGHDACRPYPSHGRVRAAMLENEVACELSSVGQPSEGGKDEDAA